MTDMPLFHIQTPTKTAPQKTILRLGKTPQHRTCPTCHQAILAAYADTFETHVDPHTLTPPAIQAARVLGIDVYRAEIRPGGQAGELWWVHPKDTITPHMLATHYWLPKHKCGAPPLPGSPIPVSNPDQAGQYADQPPF